MPFMLVRAGKYGTEDKEKQTLQKLNTTQKNQTTQNKTKLAWFSHFLRCWARKLGQEWRWTCSRAHTGQKPLV